MRMIGLINHRGNSHVDRNVANTSDVQARRAGLRKPFTFTVMSGRSLKLKNQNRLIDLAAKQTHAPFSRQEFSGTASGPSAQANNVTYYSILTCGRAHFAMSLSFRCIDSHSDVLSYCRSVSTP